MMFAKASYCELSFLEFVSIHICTMPVTLDLLLSVHRKRTVINSIQHFLNHVNKKFVCYVVCICCLINF